MKTITAKDLYGSMVALVTPMNAHNEVNYAQWKNLIKWHIRSGTRGLIVAGTTGESAMLNKDEFTQLLSLAVELSQGSETLIIAGTGAITPQQTIETTQLAAQLGAHAALVVTPYYIRIGQKALVQHFTTIADASPIPIILYNVPSRTGLDMASTTSLKLAQHPLIIGIKEAKADLTRIQQLARYNKDDFITLSGDDDSFLNALKNGATGVISVAANVRPKAINSICQAHMLGDTAQAEEINNSLKKLYQMLSSEPNPIPVKWFMHEAHMIDSGIRPPLQWLDETMTGHKTELKKINQEYTFQ